MPPEPTPEVNPGWYAFQLDHKAPDDVEKRLRCAECNEWVGLRIYTRPGWNLDEWPRAATLDAIRRHRETCPEGYFLFGVDEDSYNRVTGADDATCPDASAEPSVEKERHGVETVDLSTFPVDPAVRFAVPQSLARAYKAMPICERRGKLVVAMADPHNHYAIDDFRTITGIEIEPVFASGADIEEALRRGDDCSREPDLQIDHVTGDGATVDDNGGANEGTEPWADDPGWLDARVDFPVVGSDDGFVLIAPDGSGIDLGVQGLTKAVDVFPQEWRAVDVRVERRGLRRIAVVEVVDKTGQSRRTEYTRWQVAEAMMPSQIWLEEHEFRIFERSANRLRAARTA